MPMPETSNAAPPHHNVDAKISMKGSETAISTTIDSPRHAGHPFKDLPRRLAAPLEAKRQAAANTAPQTQSAPTVAMA